MGLFGGFKAKFSRTSRPKDAESRNGVVALNYYRIHSEFDTDSSPSQFANGVEPVPFQTASRPRSANFEDHKRDLLEKLYSQPFTHVNQTTDSEEQSKINGAKSIRFQQQPTVLDEEYNKNNSIYMSSNTNIDLPVEESNIKHYEEVTAAEQHYTYKDTPSTLIMMTQHEPVDAKSKPKPVPNTFDYNDVECTNNDNEAEEFKVNVMNHDRNYMSEDEMSYIEDDTPVRFTNGAKTIRFQEQPTVFDEEYKKSNSMYTSSNTKPIHKNIKERIDPPVEEDVHRQVTLTEDTPSTLIMMTQHEPDDAKPKFKHPASTFDYYNNQDDEEYTVSTRHHEETYNDNESEEFKVNVMHHDRNYVSEDELSYVEDEAPVSFTGYSSQAANIFFGDTAAPPIRPRKANAVLNLGNDEDEEDC